MTGLRQTLLAGIAVLAASGTAYAKDYLAHAHQLLAAGKPKEALIELSNAVRSDPGNGQAHYELARLDLQFGDAVSAEREAKAAEAHGYDANKSLTILLDSYLAQGRAIDLLHKFPVGSATGERAARIEVARGDANLSLDRQDRAAADFSRAHADAPHLNLPLFGEEDVALAHQDIPAAEKDIDAALALNPKSNEGILRKARLQLATGKVDQALSALKALVTQSPSNISDRLMLAQALLAANQNDAARAQVKWVLAAVPNSVEAIYLQASLYVADHNWKAAQVSLQQISPAMPRLPDAYFLYAVTLENLGQLKASVQAAEHYVAREPGDPRGRRLLADLLIRTNDPHGALKQLQAMPPALQSDPGVLMLYGIANRSIGKLNAAYRYFSQAAARAPKSPAPLVAMAAVQSAGGNAAGSVTTLRKAAQLAPGNPIIERLLAQAALSAGEINTARSALASLRAKEGSEAEPALAGQIDLASFDLTGAKAEYQRAEKADPKAAAPKLALARIAALEGDQTREVQLLRQVLASDPANVQAVEALSTQLTHEGKLDEAAAVLDAAHQAAPKNPEFIVNLARVYLANHKQDEARQLLDGIDPSLRDNPLILAEQVQVAMAAGNRTKAANILKSIIARQPHAVGAILALAQLDMAAKDYAAAKSVLDSGISANPHNANLLQARAEVDLKQAGLAQALAEAEKLAAAPDHQPEALAIPGNLYLAANQPAKAVSAYQKAYAEAPSAALLERIVFALNASGQHAEAESRLRSALATYPHDPALTDLLGQMDIQDNRLDAAKIRLRQSLAMNPNDAAALNNLAWIEQKQGAPDAESLATRAYYVAPLPQMADTLGWILYQHQKNGEALPLLRSAHESLPADPNVTYHYAAALAKAGKGSEAATLLKPVVAEPKDFSDKSAAKSLLASIKPAS